MNGIPVKALGKEAKNLLSSLLNPEKIFHADNKLPRDWRGLAELCGIGGELIPSIRSEDPTKKILKTWSEKNATESTIDKLFSLLEKLDRYDIIDDITPYVEKDVEYFKSNPTDACVDSADSDDEDILTHDDAERKMERKPLLTYDAFVLFDNEDIDFATNIVNTLEGQHNMKLCVKDRDLVGGRLEHSSVIKLISMRCRKIIVVVSPAFWGSPTNKYFYSLAQLDGLEKRCSKIIPCMDKPCVVPIEFRIYHTLIYTRSEKLFGNFWDQLYKSVRKVPALPNGRVSSEGNQNKTPVKSAEPTKHVNHVKFRTPSVSEEPRQEDSPVLPKDSAVLPKDSKILPKDSTVLPKNTKLSPEEENIPTMSISDDNEVVLQALKKKRSFKKLFTKIIKPKATKQEVEKGMSADDSVIMKKKSSKKKMVVAN